MADRSSLPGPVWLLLLTDARFRGEVQAQLARALLASAAIAAAASPARSPSPARPAVHAQRPYSASLGGRGSPFAPAVLRGTALAPPPPSPLRSGSAATRVSAHLAREPHILAHTQPHEHGLQHQEPPASMRLLHEPAWVRLPLWQLSDRSFCHNVWHATARWQPPAERAAAVAFAAGCAARDAAAVGTPFAVSDDARASVAEFWAPLLRRIPAENSEAAEEVANPVFGVGGSTDAPPVVANAAASASKRLAALNAALSADAFLRTRALRAELDAWWRLAPRVAAASSAEDGDPASAFWRDNSDDGDERSTSPEGKLVGKQHAPVSLPSGDTSHANTNRTPGGVVPRHVYLQLHVAFHNALVHAPLLSDRAHVETACAVAAEDWARVTGGAAAAESAAGARAAAGFVGVSDGRHASGSNNGAQGTQSGRGASFALALDRASFGAAVLAMAEPFAETATAAERCALLAALRPLVFAGPGVVRRVPLAPQPLTGGAETAAAAAAAAAASRPASAALALRPPSAGDIAVENADSGDADADGGAADVAARVVDAFDRAETSTPAPYVARLSRADVGRLRARLRADRSAVIAAQRTAVSGGGRKYDAAGHRGCERFGLERVLVERLACDLEVGRPMHGAALFRYARATGGVSSPFGNGESGDSGGGAGIVPAAGLRAFVRRYPATVDRLRSAVDARVPVEMLLPVAMPVAAASTANDATAASPATGAAPSSAATAAAAAAAAAVSDIRAALASALQPAPRPSYAAPCGGSRLYMRARRPASAQAHGSRTRGFPPAAPAVVVTAPPESDAGSVAVKAKETAAAAASPSGGRLVHVATGALPVSVGQLRSVPLPWRERVTRPRAGAQQR